MSFQDLKNKISGKLEAYKKERQEAKERDFVIRVKALVAELSGVNIDEAIEKASQVQAVAAAPAAAPAGEAKEEKKEEKKEDDKKSQEQAAAGLGALFG